MQGTAPTSTELAAPARDRLSEGRRPWWLVALALYSFLLSLVTAIPQFYYVLYALHLVTIGPHSNPLGQIWYWYNFNGDNNYVKIDSGLLAGAVEDAFLLGPLYFVTGIGLLARRRWVVPVGLMTGAMLFYGTLQLYVGYFFSGFSTLTNAVTFWLTLLPYFIYPFLLIAALLTRGALFDVRPSVHPSGSRFTD
jgi:hypothetical protein